MQSQMNDTIFAQATAPGRSGVAVIRISGHAALDACRQFGFTTTPSPRHAYYHRFKLGEKFIDDGLVLYFPAPHSFTGEDVVEFQLHGGVAIMNATLEALSTLPYLRPAKAGEFAQRAFLNGKMDLVEAEGLVDLINAQTQKQHERASQLMRGRASDFFMKLRRDILHAMALLEAYIDFPEEEIPSTVLAEHESELKALSDLIVYQCRHSEAAESLRQGYRVALVGSPNVGKSSLLNIIAGREAAIVTDVAGTTRDRIEVFVELKGLPVIFIDTAGLRETDDIVEREGIRRSLASINESDLVIQLVESGQELSKEQILPDAMIVVTKSDLAIDGKASCSIADHVVSSMTGEGVPELLDEIAGRLGDKLPPEDSFSLHRRHEVLLRQAQEAIEASLNEEELELRAEHLRYSASRLSEMIGNHDVDDILDIIFSSFCIGK